MKGLVIQVYAALVVSMPVFLIAYILTWPSYSGRYYTEDPSLLNGEFSKSQLSLLGSLPMLGCMVATIVGAFILDHLGRKRGMILGGLFFVLASALLTTTKSILLILSSRFLFGVGGGFCLAVTPIAVAEFVDQRYRGTVTTIVPIMFNGGTLASYVMGWQFGYHTVNYFVLLMAVVYMVQLMILKESPIWLLNKGMDKEALVSLKFYRGSTCEQTVILEFENMKNLMRPPKSPEYSTVTSKASYRAIGMLVMLNVFLVFMGSMAVSAYAGSFFAKAVPSLSPDLCSVILSLSNMGGCILSMFTTDIFGRRLIHQASCVIVAVTLGIVTSQMHWSWGPVWTIPAAMMLYSAGTQYGVGTIPMLLMAECLVPELKTLGPAIILTVMWVSNFVLLSTFGASVAALGLAGTFMIFCVVAVAATLFSFLFVPETKGLSSAEIQDSLENNLFHFSRKSKSKIEMTKC